MLFVNQYIQNLSSIAYSSSVTKYPGPPLTLLWNVTPLAVPFRERILNICNVGITIMYYRILQEFATTLANLYIYNERHTKLSLPPS